MEQMHSSHSNIGSSSLDYIEHNRNRCGCWTLRGQLEDKGRAFTRYARLGCKRWTCPRCGAKKAKRLRRAIIGTAIDKGLNRFLTLTLDPKTCSPGESATYSRQCWNKFRTYLKRKFGISISFITISEFQKNGYAHLHILVDRYINQAWIKSAWQGIGGGKIVFITQVDIHRVAGYLSKYLTKDMFSHGFKTRQRRYTTSRDIVLFEKISKGIWKLIKKPIEKIFNGISSRITNMGSDNDGIIQWFEMNSTNTLPA